MWKITEAMIHGQTLGAGKSTKGSTGSEAAIMPSVISVIDTKRSKRTLTTAFHTACMAAAAMTAKKTVSVMARSPAAGFRRVEVDVDEERMVVGGDLGIVDGDRADARGERRADETMVELALSRLAGDLLDVGVERTGARGRQAAAASEKPPT